MTQFCNIIFVKPACGERDIVVSFFVSVCAYVHQSGHNFYIYA